ncbi:hypothetical protein STXM2123_3434 [Streptomyces sp. F-3]|nr:hypothetical protein STXM2123_3434 [Streptomyces sp. F-3]
MGMCAELPVKQVRQREAEAETRFPAASRGASRGGRSPAGAMRTRVRVRVRVRARV